MKTYETKLSKPTEYKHLIETKCDLCFRTSKTEWKKEAYSATETEVYLKTGWLFPEGGSGEEISFDICPDCFENKLIPWVKSYGGEPTVKEWDI